LVVDDEYPVMKAMGRQLQKAGYTSVCLQDPEQAMKYFIQNQADLDLAIVDVKMPTMTGIQIAEEMCKIKPTFPVILITGAFEDIELDDANNVKTVLYKPILREDLLDTVRKSRYR
jgi:FixJ family two-component response regulator